MSHAGEKPPTLEGVRADRDRFALQRGEVSYSVISEAPKPGERRVARRVPARLSSGKILDENGRFLTECSFRNRTAQGVRLKLARDVAVPAKIQLYDDQNASLIWLDVVWRGEREIGCKRSAFQPKPDLRLLSKLKQPFYAMR